MVLGLDSVLVRQRIASIRAVEIVWEFHPFAEQDAATGPYEQQPRAYHELLRRLPTLLPDLRSLMLCLCLVEPKRYRIRGDDAEALQRTVMEPLDDMVRRLGTHVEECVVSLESGMYDCLRAKAIEAGEELEQFHLGAVQEQLWRPLHNGGTASRQGYWLQLGRRTYERSKLCTFCMPEPPDKYPEEFEVFYRPMLLI
jgi:hypothetical protein